MVKSLINPEIEYSERETIHSEDADYDANIYEMSVLGKNVLVAIGNEHKDGEISIIPVYLVLKDQSVRSIALYEVLSKNVVKDEDGDIDIDKLTGPLLFSNVDLSNSAVPNYDSIEEPEPEPEADPEAEAEPEAEPEAEAEAEPEPEAEAEPEASSVIEVPKSGKTIEDTETEEVKDGIWIQQFMSNKNYSMVDNEGGGDCLYAAIRDAFVYAGKEYTVGELRKKLSDAATEEVFQNYLQLYNMFTESIKEDKVKLQEISDKNQLLKKQLSEEKDKGLQMSIVEKAKELKRHFNQVKEEMTISKEMLDEQKFMKNVKSLQQFRAVLNTCKYWGDTWALSTLERALNMKIILLSEEKYFDEDIDNVLQCGQLNDSILEEIGSFTPDYYIILSYTGNHYKLITYKDHGIFSYEHIPHYVKDLIINKCLERIAGPYALIPEFLQKKLDESQEPVDVALSTPDIVLTYYIRSNGKPYPGKGSGEIIPKEELSTFKPLSRMKDWRRKLSNEWVALIDVDGHQWQTVEHFYQGSKYKESRKDIYYQFSLDSRSELSMSVERAKKFKDFEPDIDFFGKRGKEVLYQGLQAKFTQHKELKEILNATSNATLQQYIPKNPAKISTELMELRKNLSVV